MLSRKHQASNDALVKKATENVAFREALLKDPKDAIQKEFGIEVPASRKIFVHQNTGEETHYVLPVVKTGALTDAELDAVAGGNLGAWSCACHGCLAQCG